MFKSRYQKAYDAVTPSRKLVEDTIEKAAAGKRAGQKTFFEKPRALKLSLITAAVVLCFVMAVPICAPVCAANSSCHSYNQTAHNRQTNPSRHVPNPVYFPPHPGKKQ